MSQNNINNNQIIIDVPENMVDGIYSNGAMIAHSPTEFVVDFLHLLPNNQKVKVRSRVIISPEHTKRLMLALQENIKNYETAFGVIKVADNVNPFGRQD
jgi:hypothetical protein